MPISHGAESQVGDAADVWDRRSAWFAFGVLFCMTLLDYMDRNVLSAVLPNLTQPVDGPNGGGLGLTNQQGGLLATFFLISYAVVSPFMGWAGDRFRRTRLLFVGVAVWSLATVASGFAQSFGQLALARCVLGVGEATYGSIAPTILLDLFPRKMRSRLLSWFYLAMPIGSAFGVIVGGRVAEAFGWHYAFFLVGAPGLVMAFLALVLPDPIRGASEGIDSATLQSEETAGAKWEDYRDLAVNSSYTYAVFGMASYTFAIGGLLIWFPKFLIATRGMSQGNATLILGAVTCAAAIIGMVSGGWLSDRWARYSVRSYFLVPAVAMFLSLPFMFVGFFATTPFWMFAGIFLAETFMFVNTGPCNAIIANVVAPNLRAAAFAISVFFIHFLGDIWSPPLIGFFADLFGQADTMQTSVGQLLTAIGAVPTQKAGHPDGEMENILAGMLIVIPAILLSALVLLAGARHLPREMNLMTARLRAAAAQNRAKSPNSPNNPTNQPTAPPTPG